MKSVNRLAWTAAAVTALLASTSGVASADETIDVEAIVEDVTGEQPEQLTSDLDIGGVVTVQAADEVDETLVVTEGDQTSVVASIEAGDPSTVTFDLDLAPGHSLVATPDGGAVIFDDATLAELQATPEQVAAGIAVDVSLAVAATIDAPWAVDAEGRSLPTEYEVLDDALVQHVDTTGAVFPIAADPSFGLGWQYAFPVYYLHWNRDDTHTMTTVGGAARLMTYACDWLPGYAVAACRWLGANRASDLVNTAKSAWNSGRCVSMWQAYGTPVNYAFYDYYTRKC